MQLSAVVMAHTAGMLNNTQGLYGRICRVGVPSVTQRVYRSDVMVDIDSLLCIALSFEGQWANPPKGQTLVMNLISAKKIPKY